MKKNSFVRVGYKHFGNGCDSLTSFEARLLRLGLRGNKADYERHGQPLRVNDPKDCALARMIRRAGAEDASKMATKQPVEYRKLLKRTGNVFNRRRLLSPTEEALPEKKSQRTVPGLLKYFAEGTNTPPALPGYWGAYSTSLAARPKAAPVSATGTK